MIFDFTKQCAADLHVVLKAICTTDGITVYVPAPKPALMYATYALLYRDGRALYLQLTDLPYEYRFNTLIKPNSKTGSSSLAGTCGVDALTPAMLTAMFDKRATRLYCSIDSYLAMHPFYVALLN
jgi:hypothetical protein